MAFSFTRQIDGTAIIQSITHNEQQSTQKPICEFSLPQLDWGGKSVLYQMFDQYHTESTELFSTLELPSSENLKHLISYLKSLLQKSIRRNKVNTALSAAKELCRLSPIHLMRRLPIIVIEDAVLNLDMTGAVWLMMAIETNGYKITMKDFDWIMRFVARLATEKNQDPVSLCSDHIELKTTTFDLVNSIPKFGLVQSAIICISFRTKLDGIMHGDLIMMKKSVLVWLERIKDNEWIKYLKNNHDRLINLPNEIIPIPDLIKIETEKETMIASNDFHCSANIPKKIVSEQGLDNISIKDVKQAIWLGNSCKNVKESFFPLTVTNPPELWNQIEQLFYSKSETILVNLLKSFY